MTEKPDHQATQPRLPETSGEEARDTPLLARARPGPKERATIEQIDTDGATPGASRYRITPEGGNAWDIDVINDGHRYYWNIVQDALGVDDQGRPEYASEEDALRAAVKSIEGRRAEEVGRETDVRTS